MSLSAAWFIAFKSEWFNGIDGLSIAFSISNERRCLYDMPNGPNKNNVNYAKTNLKRIPLDVQKEKYDQIKVVAGCLSGNFGMAALLWVMIFR